jgi:RecA-family ATPase
VASPLPEVDDIYQKYLAEELFKLRIRRDARKNLESEELALASETNMAFKPTLVYDALPNEIPELIPGILPESGTLGIVGETDTGKSLIALEIASSLLTGEKLWGAITPNRTIKHVVYILGEHTAATLQGLYHRTGLPHSGDFRIVDPSQLHPYKALVIGGVAQPVAIDRMMKLTEGADLIVFDPLAGFGQGEKMENDNSGMRTLMDTLSLIAQKNTSACMVLHHMGKATMGQDGREYKRENYASRGATSIEDSLTHCFYLRKKTLIAGKDGMEKYELSVRKFKGVVKNDVFVLERDADTKRNTLINAADKRAGKDSTSREERARFWVQVTNLQERKPKLDWDTCIEMVAAAHGLAMATVKRWEGGSES